MSQQSSIRIAHSLKVHPAAAVKEFYAGVVQPNMAIVILSKQPLCCEQVPLRLPGETVLSQRKAIRYRTAQ